MNQLHLLAVALGLAALAGVNLYLTVFATGLAIHLHWIVLAPQYDSLAVLGDPLVLGIGGALYFLEFFADKIPWIDSAWDAVHTIIRPIGGALLAIQVLGHPTPAFDVAVALLAGTTSLAAHTAKSATRLFANTSPEPFSNIGLSVGEDVAVLGGLALVYHNPLLALGIFVLALALFFYFAPRILRSMKAKIYLAFAKLNGPAARRSIENLPTTIPARWRNAFAKVNPRGESIAWAAPCLSGRGRGIPPNLFGALVATHETPTRIFFVARKLGRDFAQTIETQNLTVARESKFLSENLVLLDGGKPKFVFVFARSRQAMADRAAEMLQARPAPPSALAPNELEPAVVV